MRLLQRNCRKMEYLPFLGETDVDPDTGMHTGEPVMQYGDPVPLKGNISVPSRRTDATLYGEDVRYTHELMLPLKRNGPKIDEYGLIRFRDELYDIQAVRESLNFIAVALQKQTVNHGEAPEPDGDGEASEPYGDGEAPEPDGDGESTEPDGDGE